MKTLRLLLLIATLALSTPAWAYLFASGSYTGNGTSQTVDISATTTPSVTDFQPDVVFAKCDTATSGAWRTSAMAANTSYTPNLSSTGVTDKITGFTANGFTVGASAGVNGSGVTCWYVAMAADASNDLAVGSFNGNGTDNTDIDISDTSAQEDFQPQAVFVQQSAASSSAMAANAGWSTVTCFFTASDTCNTAGYIKQMNANGFRVGNPGFFVNVTSVTNYYLAIKAVSGSTAGGNFAGNTEDSRSITAPGFQPDWMVIKGSSATTQPCSRFKNHSGDDSILWSNVASAVNQVEAFGANGFTVGTADCSNRNTDTMYWYTIKAQPTSTFSQPPQVVIVE